MISLQGALAAYAAALRPLAPQERALGDALGHVLAEDVASRVDLPMFTQSAVDGYALHSADAAATLRVIGEIAAGTAPTLELPRGCAARIFTGGALPAGADTCARQEIVERIGDEIRLQKSLAVGADTRFRGEEVREGATLARAGQRLHSGMIASLAMAGVPHVAVRPKPRIALIVTGNEVAGDSPRAGEIFDANGPLISSWLRERGYPLASVRHVRDEPARLRSALTEAIGESDL
ncbi:MAG TPA: molybdopterin molybdotransferase MoeA, partial [Nevskiaceae bacterium]|nr:molybdopterin molybdotransferase MoeA [Nevskiaceae bacterium]